MADGFDTTARRVSAADAHAPLDAAELSPLDLVDQNPAQIAAALCMDQRHRWQRGERTTSEEYERRYLHIEFDGELLLDLVYNEYLLRGMYGPAPSEEEFLNRFPDLVEELTRLFEVHRAIESDDELQALDSTDTTKSPTHVAEERGDLESSAIPIGDATIGGYELIEEIGRGGMGIVYKARQQGTNRVVALKTVLVGRYASPQAVARFRAEAMAAGRLDHPGIVSVHEFGRDEDVYYYSMAYVEGENLANRLARGSLAHRDANKLLGSICDAIHYAHNRGITHRDLKPQNILIDTAGRPRIVDFGLAKLEEQVGTITCTGQVLGSANYLAPEQARGEHHKIGPTADIFSMGVILYEAITGQPPFQGPTVVAILSNVVNEEPIPPRVLDRSIPRDLETICLKCLSKNPEGRYASARALGEELKRLQEGRPILARPVRWYERVWRWCRRHPAVATLAGTVALLCCLLALSNVALRHQRDRAEASKSQAVEAKDRAQRNLAESRLKEARSLRLSGHAGQRVQSLAAISQAMQNFKELGQGESELVRLRNEAAACFRLCDVQLERKWNVGDARSASFPVAFDRKTARYASVGAGGAILIRDLDENRLIGRLEGQWQTVRQIAFSPRGTHLAASVRSDSQMRAVLWQIGAVDHSPVDLGEASSGKSVIDFSPNGKTLAVVAKDGSIRLQDIARQVVTRQIEFDDFHARGCRFHPTKPLFAIWGDHVVRVFGLGEDNATLGPSSVTAISPPDGEEVESGIGSNYTDFVHSASQSILHVAWNNRWEVLATGVNDHNAYLWDLSNNEKPYATLREHQTWVDHLAFDPSGRYLLTSGMDGTTLVWRSATGRLCLKFRGDRTVFSADGENIGGVRNGQVVRWRFFDHPERTLIGNPRTYEAYEGDISPCGRWLATAAWDGIRLWDLRSNTPIVKLHNRDTYRVTFSPDGRHLFGHDTDGIVRWALNDDFPATESSIVGPARIGPSGYSNVSAFSLTRDSKILALSRTGGSSIGVRAGGGDYDFREVKTNTLAVHPSGELLAIARGSVIEICPELDGKPVVKIPMDESIDVICFSPQGRWLLAVTKGMYHLVDTESWKKTGSFDCGRDYGAMLIRAFDFSEDERWLAIGCQDFRIDVIDVQSGQLYVSLPSPAPGPWVCLSPDGRQLACFGEEAKAHLWDLGLIRRRFAEMGLAESEGIEQRSK